MKTPLNNKQKILITTSAIVLCAVIAVVLVFSLNKYSITFDFNEEDTFYVEYGEDTIPEVVATYQGSLLHREGTSVEVTQEGTVDFTTLGSYEITYTASYEDITATATRTIVVQDTLPPVITLNGATSCYVSPGYSYAEEGFIAEDNYDGNVTAQVVRTDESDAVTYTAVDSSGNTSEVTRTIIYKDIIAPVLSLTNGETVNISYGSTFSDPGYSAIDDVDGDITASVIIEGTVNTNQLGEQTLRYRITDSSGNETAALRTFCVKDLTAPTITLSGDAKTYVLVGSSYQEPGYTATDNMDGDLTGKVSVSGSVDTSKTGAYTISYTVSDSAGNSTTKSRTIYVYTKQSSTATQTPSGKVIYLTFDDGPGKYTAELLDILDRYNVKATFFVTNQFPNYQYLIGESYRRGHTIAIHTYSHKFAEVYASESAYYEDLNKMSAICEAQTGVAPTIIRFPGGTSNTTSRKYCSGIMSALTQSLPACGYYYCDWNVDSNDAGGTTTASGVAQNVIKGISGKSSAIVLQHDIQKYSVDAVEEIICWGLANGYTFLPLTESSPMVHQRVQN